MKTGYAWVANGLHQEWRSSNLKIKKMPSLKGKKRYITFKIHTDFPAFYNEMKGAILNSILKWMGESSYSNANIRIIKNLWDEKNQVGWIECSNDYIDDVKMSLALIHQIGDGRVIIQTIRVSGTIKSGKEKIYKLIQ